MKKILLISTIVALAAVSCTKSELDGAGAVSGQIQVSTTIASVQSRGLVEDPASVLTDVAFVHAQVATASNPVSFAGQTAFGGNRASSGNIAFASGNVPTYDKASDKISYLMGYHPAGTATGDIVSWTPDGATDILVTNLWNAGTYTAPVTTGMNFGHILSRIEVKVKYASGSSSEAVSDTWGKIQGIAFEDAPTTISLGYTDNKVIVGASKANFALLNGSTYTPGNFVEVPITSTGNVVAGAMIPPSGLSSFTLIATTEKQGNISLPVTLSASKKIEAGMIYTATIEFNAQDKTVSARMTNIDPWKPIMTDNRPSVPSPVKGPVIEFGKAPHSVTTGLTRGVLSHNALYGENTANPGTNGSYYTTDLLAFAGEPPYPRLEIDLVDVHIYTFLSDAIRNWRQLKGTDQDICKSRQGGQWRMPRLSEQVLMQRNKATLDATGGGYVPLFSDFKYWTATEYDKDKVWCCSAKGLINAEPKTERNYSYRVRCVRELPLIESVVLEYGQAPHSDITNLPTTTYTSYRALYGENAANPGTNGRYYTDLPNASAGEPPYYKFEVAATDILGGNGVPLAMTWRVAQRTDFDDNICALERGPGWRLPRVSEMRLMLNNATTMVKMGLQPFTTGYYWTATENNATNAFSFHNTGISYRTEVKGTILNYVRCVKESLRPTIGDYYYSDKSSSPTLQTGKTLLGIVYRVNPDGTGMLVEVNESAALVWSTVQEPTGATGEDSGVANTTIIKGLPDWATKYPVFKYCEGKNTGGVTGWYLPAKKELKALYAGYCGLRWMASGANSANGEINDWANSISMPGNANYATARTAFNAKMTAPGVGGTAFATRFYWNATEYSTFDAWFVMSSDGFTGSTIKTNTNLIARCVREF